MDGGVFLTIALLVLLVVFVLTAFANDWIKRREAARVAAEPPPPRPRHEVEREEQLKALFAAVPTTPPERMRATIHVNPSSAFALLHSQQTGALVSTEVVRYSVDMVLELPEKDRALLEQQHLDQVVIGKEPRYSSEQILNILGERERMETRLAHSLRTSDMVALRVMRNEPQRNFESYEAEMREVKIGEYLQVPYSRAFRTKPEANDYADRLREVILPKIRELLDKAASRDSAPSATVEF